MFYFKDDNQITVYFTNGSSAVWANTHKDYSRVCSMVEDNNWISIEMLHNENKLIMDKETTIEQNNIVVKGSDGSKHKIDMEKSDNPVVHFIQLLKNKGVIDSELSRIKPFLTNMFENKYIDAVTEIYDFCKAMDFEITEDGCFLAYKNVRKDLSSIHDNGATKHTIGEYTEVTEFNTDRNQTCSTGLHFCSKGYLQSYAGDTTIIVKIDPRDVVAIPVDYNNMKGRCKRYMPIGILGTDGNLNTTNIEAMTDGKVTIVKTEKQAKADKKAATKAAPNRILETVKLMSVHNNDAKKVASIMNISVETVKRNMRKYRAM